MKKIFNYLIFCCIAFAMAACNSGGSANKSSINIQPAEEKPLIDLNKPLIKPLIDIMPAMKKLNPPLQDIAKIESINISIVNNTIHLGYTGQYNAIGTLSNKKHINITKSVHWSSSNPEIAAIDADGVITPVSIGDVKITATIANFTASDTIHIQAALLVGVKITPGTPGSEINVPVRLKAYGIFSDHFIQDISNESGIKWSSVNPQILSVTESGLATPLMIKDKTRYTTVNLDYKNLGANAVFEIRDFKDISINQNQIAWLGFLQPLYFMSTDLNDATSIVKYPYYNVQWTSSDSSIASISNNTITFGNYPLTPLKVGTIKAKVKYGFNVQTNASVEVKAKQFAYIISNGNIQAYEHSPNGDLTKKSSTSLTGGLQIISDPSRKHIYASTNSGIKAYISDSTTGYLTILNEVSTKAAPTSISINPTGKTLYLVAGSTVYTYSINQDTGAISGLIQNTQVNGNKLIVSPSGKHAYVIGGNNGLVQIFAISDDGQLNSNSTDYNSPLGNYFANLAITADNRYAYAANPLSNKLAIFKVDQSTGALTANGDIDSTGVYGVSISIDNWFLATTENGMVNLYRISKGASDPSGDLELLKSAAIPGSQAEIVMAPSIRTSKVGLDFYTIDPNVNSNNGEVDYFTILYGDHPSLKQNGVIDHSPIPSGMTFN